jgi:hypothetical protein
MKFTYLYRYRLAEIPTVAARKLQALNSDQPSPAKFRAVDRAIKQAKFILQRINTSTANRQPAKAS